MQHRSYEPIKGSITDQVFTISFILAGELEARVTRLAGNFLTLLQSRLVEMNIRERKYKTGILIVASAILAQPSMAIEAGDWW
jgi:hypothetical protein